ncbi:MAG: transcriptional regulator [Alphaproteobacteria bacterium CG11_big_fil_rev_8_21_14_0_20_39_49]|nr:MAG: transcriptional regulator [Alphaproteobacteria bacterium CG11_big_fil_rev_8_21_14_0_20_39_49]
MTNKNDSNWEKLFEKHSILHKIEKNSSFTIHSSQINEFRESRLMTKFDNKNNLPEIFKKHNLSILPISRGSYTISNFENYKEFNTESQPSIEYLEFPDNIQSIDFKNITSEATAVNCAYVSGILDHFLEEEDLLPTISGRMSSSKFSFTINNTDNSKAPLYLDVNNAQIEIDGGYEGRNYLSLIEAKNSISSNFIIRQLYYPFRCWENKVTKKIKLIFLVYTNGVFDLYEYQFEEPNNYNSLILVKHKKYSIEELEISINTIEKILDKTDIISEPDIPFPQADSFERIINLCELLNENIELTKEEITNTYDFDKRQTDYYTNAGIYLGFIKKERSDVIKYSLTNKGQELFKENYIKRQLLFIRSILEHDVFHKTLSLYFKKADIPTKNEVIKIMRDCNVYNVNKEKTFSRRASTILSWINWILSLSSK